MKSSGIVLVLMGLLLMGLSLRSQIPSKPQIAFFSDRGGQFQVYIIDTATRIVSRLAGNGWGPRWSPDGKKLLFYAYTDLNVDPVWGRDWNIYTVNADGTNLTQLTRHPAEEMHSAWSPDGQNIVFTSTLAGKNNGEWNYELYLMDAHGDDVRRLTNRPDSYDGQPDWSPDGTQIVFRSDGVDGEGLCVIDLSGDNFRWLARLPGSAIFPRWSPDGSKVLFTLVDGQKADIYTVDADGRNLQNLTKNVAFNHRAVWSPDGRLIAFASNRSGNDEIYLMSTKGELLEQLTNNPGRDYPSDWFDPAFIRAVTPGGKQRMTWGWLKTLVIERVTNSMGVSE